MEKIAFTMRLKPGQAAEYERRHDAILRITQELARYTDRELADLGLCRSEIPAVADGTYRRA